MKISLWHQIDHDILSIFKKKLVKAQIKTFENIKLSCLQWQLSRLSGQAFWMTQFGGPARSQTVRWRFIYVNGKLHRETTKPFILTFTGVLY